MADPMIIILIVAAAISAVTGIYEEGIEGITDTVIILIVVIVNAVLGVYQGEQGGKSHRGPSGHERRHQQGPCATARSASSQRELVEGDVVLLEGRRRRPRRRPHL